MDNFANRKDNSHIISISPTWTSDMALIESDLTKEDLFWAVPVLFVLDTCSNDLSSYFYIPTGDSM